MSCVACLACKACTLGNTFDMYLIVPRAVLTISGMLVALVIVGVIMLLYLPKASVNVFPATNEQTTEQTITLSGNTQEPDFKQYVLPAKIVDTELHDSLTVKRSGGDIKPGLAHGTVRLINKQDEEQPLLPKTHLRHEETGVYFLTDKAVRIPPKGEMTITVTAQEEGVRGNVSAGRFVVDKLLAPMQSQLYAESDTDFSGGEEFEQPLKEEEINKEKDELTQSLIDRAKTQLSSQAGGAGIRDELTSIEVVNTSSSVELGSRATTYVIKANIRARSFVVNENDLLSLTLLALRQMSNDDEEFISYQPESFGVKLIKADFDRKEARVVGHLTGDFASKTGTKVFDVKKLAGRSVGEVTEYFKQFEGIDHVEVNLSPFWVQHVPARDESVQINLVNK